MKIKSVLLLAVLFFSSCSTQAPDVTEVANLAKQWYAQQSLGDGAGMWEVTGVSVLSVKVDANRKGVFNTTSLVMGTRKHPPLAEPRPDENFSDTLRMDLRWNGAKWVTVE